MKNLLSILFGCYLSFSSISALETSVSADSVREEIQFSVCQSEEGETHMRAFNSENIINESNVYYYRIKEIDIVERIITLEDDSKWDIGFWYKDIILDWQKGDRITFSRNGIWNEWGLQNLDKGSVAWGGILYHWFFPSVEKSDFVVDINYENSDFYGIVTLKSGFQFGLLTWIPVTFETGDAVFIYQLSDRYVIEKVNKVNKFKLAIMLTAGNSDWRNEPQ